MPTLTTSLIRSNMNCAGSYHLSSLAFLSSSISRGVIPGGAGGPQPPQLLANNTFFGFSHTTDIKVPSEVVLVGSFMSVKYGNV